MSAIGTSVFDFFKIGPGPSSSHTIGPMKAGYDFLQTVRALPGDVLGKARTIEVKLYGSLGATGKAHGTDRSVLAGLLGNQPETCPTDFLDGLLRDTATSYEISLNKHAVRMTSRDIIFESGKHDFPYSNTLVIRLLAGRRVVFEREYYSVGGGFLQWKGWKEPEKRKPVYTYNTAAQIRKLLIDERLRLHELILENEKAITGASEQEICAGLDARLQVMEQTVRQGVTTEEVLPGPIGLHRKAPSLFRQAQRMPRNLDHFMLFLSAYAFAAAEENAAGHTVVTAPTCGSAGVIPSVSYIMKHHWHLPGEAIRHGLLAAAAVGFLAKHNASIAGAEVGCQGEIGVASSMAAAMLAYVHTSDFLVVENAAETALEHHLGMTCDPVDGYVQIPCIERNAMGAVKAYTAYLIATAEVSRWHVVDLDKVIRAMAETGRDMSAKYKETSKSGLAKKC